MFSLQTENTIAYNSLDHLYPDGTMYDNNTSLAFIECMERMFLDLTVMDLGCAGGQTVVDFHNRGHKAMGLEGSDYSILTKRANWPEYHGKNLFTCDVTKPFTVLWDGEPVKFNLIMAWEFLEHVHDDELPYFLENVVRHMANDGVFVGSIFIPQGPKPIGSIDCHNIYWPRDEWMQKLGEFFHVEGFPYPHTPRDDSVGLKVLCRKKG